MLFFIGFGILTLVLIGIVTAIAQPPTRWVERYVDRSGNKFPSKKSTKPQKPESESGNPA